MDEIQTGGGAGVQGDVGTGGGPFAGRDSQRNTATVSNTVRVESAALDDIKRQLDSIEAKFDLRVTLVENKIADLRSDQSDIKADIRALKSETELVLRDRRPPPITWFQIVSLIILSISTIAIIIILGVFFSGMYR